MNEDLKTRKYGVHLTPSGVCEGYILPEIKECLRKFAWVDFYAGEGNLIFPILKLIPRDEREAYFKERIFLFDVQEEMVEKCVANAIELGISEGVARKNAKKRDSLREVSPNKMGSLPLYHITNPPYLYLGYITKTADMQTHLPCFAGHNEGYQDLYQIAMMNDLRGNVEQMVYIVPTNFIYGNAVSNKIRLDFFKRYDIAKAILFEKAIFESTGIGVGIFFFRRKKKSSAFATSFDAIKVRGNDEIVRRHYELKPEHKYRAGWEFDEFLSDYKPSRPLAVSFYLTRADVERNIGDDVVRMLDANSYNGQKYDAVELKVSSLLAERIKSNILYARTIDTGTAEGRLCLGVIRDDFKVDGIYAMQTARTHPIPIFLLPRASYDDQLLLCDYFNLAIEHWRSVLDSDFLTNYKYSEGDYARKYMGLTQARKLIETFPILLLSQDEKERLRDAVYDQDFDAVIAVLKKKGREEDKITRWFGRR